MIPRNLIQLFNNKIPYIYKAPINNKPVVCFIPGFRSDFISSKKSNYFYDTSIQDGYGFLSWNHSVEGSVFDWYQDGCELIKNHKVDYFIGASMGLWLSLLLSVNNPDIRGILGIGGSFDFTERWLKNEIPNKNDMDYVWKRPSEYSETGYYEIPLKFLIESKPALISNFDISSISCPIHLVHGEHDKDVPIQLAQKQCQYLVDHSLNADIFTVKGGDHQLSKSQDLAFLKEKFDTLLY